MLPQTVSILIKLHTNTASKGASILTMQISLMRTKVISTGESFLAKSATIFRGNTGCIRPPKLIDDVLLEDAHAPTAVVDTKTVS